MMNKVFKVPIISHKSNQKEIDKLLPTDPIRHFISKRRDSASLWLTVGTSKTLFIIKSLTNIRIKLSPLLM